MKSYYTMSNKELSQLVRKTLKEAGFTSKDVSVRVKDSGYSTSVRVTVKNPFVKISEVKKVVNRFEEIDRDERTMEILQGCNVFVHVQYECGIIEEAAKELMPTSEMVLSNIEKYSGHKIADNGKKEVFITHYEGSDWTLYEKEKEESKTYEYKPAFWVRSPQNLAVAMWRFKNLGTIYA